MNRNLRLIAAALGALAGLLQLYNTTVGRAAGTPVSLGGVAMGLFWLGFAAWIYGDRSRPDPKK